MNLLLLDLLQQALGWIAAISLELSEALSLLPGASLGGHLAVAPFLVNVKGFAAFAALPISVVALGTVCRMASVDGHSKGGWWSNRFHAVSMLFRPIFVQNTYQFL